MRKGETCLPVTCGDQQGSLDRTKLAEGEPLQSDSWNLSHSLYKVVIRDTTMGCMFFLFLLKELVLGHAKVTKQVC